MWFLQLALEGNFKLLFCAIMPFMAKHFGHHIAHAVCDCVMQTLYNLDLTWCNVAFLYTHTNVPIVFPTALLHEPYKTPFEIGAIHTVRFFAGAFSCPDMIIHGCLALSQSFASETWANFITVAQRGVTIPEEELRATDGEAKRRESYRARKAKHKERVLVQWLLILTVVPSALICNYCAIKEAQKKNAEAAAFIQYQNVLLVFLLYSVWLILDDRAYNMGLQLHTLFICSSFIVEGRLVAHFLGDCVDTVFNTLVLLVLLCLVLGHHRFCLTVYVYDWLLVVEKRYVSYALVVAIAMTLGLNANEYTNASVVFRYVTEILIQTRIFGFKKGVSKRKETFHGEVINSIVVWFARTVVLAIAFIVLLTLRARAATDFNRMMRIFNSTVHEYEFIVQERV